MNPLTPSSEVNDEGRQSQVLEQIIQYENLCEKMDELVRKLSERLASVLVQVDEPETKSAAWEEAAQEPLVPTANRIAEANDRFRNHLDLLDSIIRRCEV